MRQDGFSSQLLTQVMRMVVAMLVSVRVPMSMLVMVMIVPVMAMRVGRLAPPFAPNNEGIAERIPARLSSRLAFAQIDEFSSLRVEHEQRSASEIEMQPVQLEEAIIQRSFDERKRAKLG